MQLACESVVPGLSCEYVAKGDDVVAVQSEMMAHGRQSHSHLLDGASPQEMSRTKEEMEAHIFDLLTIR
ncbi:MAG: hypothetical protein GY720_22305 [bacterium]|nr:hypothetical protein [bacterium]